MKKYKLVNNLTGWVIFLISSIVYLMTIEDVYKRQQSHSYSSVATISRIIVFLLFENKSRANAFIDLYQLLQSFMR